MNRRLLATAILLFAPLFGIDHFVLAESPQAVKRVEFIFETAPFKSCHASTIAESSQGLVAAWFGGTAESHPDVGIWLSRHVNGKWTAPIEVANGVESATVRHACWNPVLFQPQSGPLCLYYKVGLNPRTWWGMVIKSENGGASWSSPEKLPEGIIGPIKNKPVQLSTGEIISPCSTEDSGWRIHFERSLDLGKTWTKTKPLNSGETIAAIQPSLLVHRDGRLQAIGRTKQKRVFDVWSSDRGQTWIDVKLLNLPNPNSGTDASTLADGRHLIIYNHTDKGRSPLNVAVSNDGKNWQAAMTLENLPGEYSYPAVIQAKDGLVHFTYTWKRERIRHIVVDPKEFVLTPIVDGIWPQ